MDFRDKQGLRLPKGLKCIGNGKKKGVAEGDKRTFLGPKVTFWMHLGSPFQKMTPAQKRPF